METLTDESTFRVVRYRNGWRVDAFGTHATSRVRPHNAAAALLRRLPGGRRFWPVARRQESDGVVFGVVRRCPEDCRLD